MPRKYSVVSLFSGAMGLDIGFHRTGHFNLLAAVEKVTPYCETIRKNIDAGRVGSKSTFVLNEDIKNVCPHALMETLGILPGDLDVLIGGPPCQSFSTTGRRGTVQDHRGTLLWDFLRFVDAFRPKFFLMENVRGLVSAALRHRPISDRPDKGGPPLEAEEMPGSVLRSFAGDLAVSEYRLDCFEVNAVNYGAPQIRERLLCVGNRLGYRVDFPAPTHVHPEEAKMTGLPPFKSLGSVIGPLSPSDHEVMDFSPRKKKYLSFVPPGGNWRAMPVEIQQESMGKAFHAKGGRSGWWRRLSMDLPAPTIVTMPNHASTSLCHPEEVRALSLQECAAVQEFPADWEFEGTLQNKYTQVGNAVPVVLGEVAANVINDYLGGKISALREDLFEDDRFRIVYVKSHIRTRKWFADGEACLWSSTENGTALTGTPVTLRRERVIGPAMAKRAV
jgi:DNA (cytosine-5)-methyltransferase 1